MQVTGISIVLFERGAARASLEIVAVWKMCGCTWCSVPDPVAYRGGGRSWHVLMHPLV
jgi:hypothetical protein